MPSRSPLWGPPDEDEAVEALIELAEDDWMDIGALVFEVGRRLPGSSSLRKFVHALGELAGVLMDHGVVPGDLGMEPDMQPWPGTRQERVDRIVREALALDRIPSPTEIAWFYYLPNHDPRLIGRTEN
jgi:hypothetical protein